MEVVKLGEVETEVLSYLAKHKAQNAKKIATALKKGHTVYVIGSISTLLEKNMIEKVGKYKPHVGRPALLYSLNYYGVVTYLLNVKKDYMEVLDNYKDDDMVWILYVLYKSLNEVGVDNINEAFSKMVAIGGAMYSNVSKDPGEILGMVTAWAQQYLMKLPEKQQIKLREVIAREMGDDEEENKQVKQLRKRVNSLKKDSTVAKS